MTNGRGPTTALVVHAMGLGLKYGRPGRRRCQPMPALADISFTVKPGEALAVVGANGAGKTTLLRLTAGLLKPSTGEIRVLGTEPSRRSRRFLTNIALISGNRSQLIPELRVRDSLEFAQIVFDIPSADYRRRTRELLAELRIEHLIDTPVAQLSLGQRVRADIVMGLLHLPRLVLLDEPSLGLDLEGQEIVRRFFPKYCRREGAGLLLTSHQNLDIVEIATEAVLLQHGHARYTGPLRKLLDKHADELGATVSVTTRDEAPTPPSGVPLRDVSWNPVTRVATIAVAEPRIGEVTRWCLENMSVEQLVVDQPSQADVLAHVLRSVP